MRILSITFGITDVPRVKSETNAEHDKKIIEVAEVGKNSRCNER